MLQDLRYLPVAPVAVSALFPFDASGFGQADGGGWSARVLHRSRTMRDWISALEDRTMAFAVRVVQFLELLEETRLPRRVIWQLVDAATSMAANHRACRRSRSDRELVAKLSIVDEEADESAFWLELIQRRITEPQTRREVDALHDEVVQLRAIFAKARATTKGRGNS